MRILFRNQTPDLQAHVVSNNTTTLYLWLTGWLSCDGVDNIRFVARAKNATGSGFRWQPAIQYAAVREDSPGAPGTLGTQQTDNGDYGTGDISVSTDMGNNRMFRLGIAYSSSTASVQQGDVYLQATWKQVGTYLGSRQVQLDVDGTGTRYQVLTDWMPATFMSYVKAAFVLTTITGTSANLKYRLAYQTAATMTEQPTGWTDAEQGWTTPQNTYDERNTGEVSLSTSNMWFRLGVAYALTSGSTVTTAVLDACCACR